MRWWTLAFLVVAVLFTHECSAAGDAYGLVSVPVSCMRTAPGHDNEQSSQAVLGTPVKILLQSGDWYKVETPDGYTGYMRSNTLKPVTASEYERWKASSRVVCRAWLTRLVNADMQPVGYATAGAVLSREEGSPAISGYLSVRTPTGDVVYVMQDDVWADTDCWLRSFREADAGSVIARAETMLGCPYLWGGTSSLAPDCSGFVQMAFVTAGLLLPRDTSEQVQCGLEVLSLEDAVPGDLVFFGNRRGRVNHVAIYLGQGRIIHSSGSVHRARLSDDAPGDEPRYAGRIISIRRILGTDPALLDGVRLVSETMYF